MRRSLIHAILISTVIPAGACHVLGVPGPDAKVVNTIAAALRISLDARDCGPAGPLPEQAPGRPPYRLCSSAGRGWRATHIIDADGREIALRFLGQQIRRDSAGRTVIDSVRSALQQDLGPGLLCEAFRSRWTMTDDVVVLDWEPTSDVVRGPLADWGRVRVSVGMHPAEAGC